MQSNLVEKYASDVIQIHLVKRVVEYALECPNRIHHHRIFAAIQNFNISKFPDKFDLNLPKLHLKSDLDMLVENW